MKPHNRCCLIPEPFNIIIRKTSVMQIPAMIGRKREPGKQSAVRCMTCFHICDRAFLNNRLCGVILIGDLSQMAKLTQDLEKHASYKEVMG